MYCKVWRCLDELIALKKRGEVGVQKGESGTNNNEPRCQGDTTSLTSSLPCCAFNPVDEMLRPSARLSPHIDKCWRDMSDTLLLTTFWNTKSLFQQQTYKDTSCTHNVVISIEEPKLCPYFCGETPHINHDEKKTSRWTDNLGTLNMDTVLTQTTLHNYHRNLKRWQCWHESRVERLMNTEHGHLVLIVWTHTIPLHLHGLSKCN